MWIELFREIDPENPSTVERLNQRAELLADNVNHKARQRYHQHLANASEVRPTLTVARLGVALGRVPLHGIIEAVNYRLGNDSRNQAPMHYSLHATARRDTNVDYTSLHEVLRVRPSLARIGRDQHLVGVARKAAADKAAKRVADFDILPLEIEVLRIDPNMDGPITKSDRRDMHQAATELAKFVNHITTGPIQARLGGTEHLQVA